MLPNSVKFIILLLIILPLVCKSQVYDLSSKSKKAKKFYEAGELYLKHQNSTEAEISFKKAIEEDPNFYEAYMMLGDMYEQDKSDSAAVVYYKKAVEIAPDKFPAAFFIVANLEYKNGWYRDAFEHYKSYLGYPGLYEKNQLKASKNLESCEFAMKAIQNPVPFHPVNLGKNVNSAQDDYFPCLTADNQTLLFTRLLKDKNAPSGRQEDFFVSNFLNGEWQPAVSIGPPINTIYNEGAPTLSADGNMLIFTACESVNGYGSDRQGYGRCDLFASKKVGNNWSVPYNIGAPVNSRHWESQPSLSSDGKTIYYVSNRDNNYDIWCSVMTGEGEWGIPVKLGDNINTDGYEGSVFIHPDNQTLYFSSDGHTGMGGLDIFVSRRDSAGNWGVPVNLGYPINTFKDENSILISANGKLAMLASDRKDGFGGLDLYSFELYESARPQPVTYMKGTVYDKESGEKLEARFELTDLNSGKLAVQSFSNEGNGEFLVCLPAHHDYALTVSKEGYLFYSENFNLEGENPSTDPVLKDIPLEKLKTGAKVILKNIFFETDKYELKDASKVELQKLTELLTKNPALKIEIGGHTDNVGTPQYNQILSENRAKAVYNYLIGNGIDPSRLSFKGYGETQPLDTNQTETGRANNRRTEFKVVD